MSPPNMRAIRWLALCAVVALGVGCHHVITNERALPDLERSEPWTRFLAPLRRLTITPMDGRSRQVRMADTGQDFDRSEGQIAGLITSFLGSLVDPGDKPGR